MSRQKIIVFAMLCLLMLPFNTLGQEDAGQVVLLHNTGAADLVRLRAEVQIISLSDASVQTIPLPSEAV